jgi:hypothetical protein
MSHEVVALAWSEELEGGRDQRADLIEGSWPRRSQERFQFREGEFDRIEVGAVGGEEPHVRTSRFDGRLDRRLFVCREVVQDNDIPWVERGHQDLLDVREERGVVDRSVEDRRRPKAAHPQGGDDGVRLPMSAGRVITQARPDGTPTVSPQQVGRDATFVEKHILAHVSQRLPGAPLPPCGGDIRPTLFVGVYRFF